MADVDVVLTVNQKVTFGINPKDRFGNPAPVEGIIWMSSDESILTVTPDETGLSCVASTVGNPGNAQVIVKADPNLSPEITEELTGIANVQVLPEQAVSLGITAGTPVDRE